MEKNSTTVIVYILPLTPITPEGGWNKSRIYLHTFETSHTILKKTVYNRSALLLTTTDSVV